MASTLISTNSCCDPCGDTEISIVSAIGMLSGEGSPEARVTGAVSGQLYTDLLTGALYQFVGTANTTTHWTGVAIGNVLAFGADPTGVASSALAFTNAITAMSALSLPLLIPPGTYKGAPTFLVLGNIPYVVAFGANLVDIKVVMNGTNQHWYGGRFVLGASGQTDPNEVISLSGTNCTITQFDVAYDNAPGTAAWQACEFTGTNCRSTDFHLNMGSRGGMVILGGNGTVIANGFSQGGDDCFTIKATLQDTTNVNISNVTAYRHSNVLTIGTEVAFAVRGVNATNLIARSCTYGVWLKPGNVSYQNGTVEDINITNLEINDPLGIANQIPISIDGKFGSTIKRVHFTNVTATVRCLSTGFRRSFIDFFLNNCDVSDITFTDCDFRDANGGLLAGTGNQVLYGIVTESANGASITNIKFKNVLIDGTGGEGYIEAGAINSTGVSFEGCHFRNNNNGTGAFVMNAQGRIRIDDTCVIETALSGPPITCSAGVLPICNRMQFRIKDLAAGANAVIPLFAVPRKSQIVAAWITPSTSIFTSATDYTTYRLYNNFVAVDTATTSTQNPGGQILFAQDMNAFSANIFSVAAAILTFNEILTLYKTDTGAGQAIADGLFTIDYVPYGIT